MGFILLANIPAICGIYMAFFPVLVYAVLASSQHNSMGEREHPSLAASPAHFKCS
jgi:MFS superfamily sulfate permease-like transporter